MIRKITFTLLMLPLFFLSKAQTPVFNEGFELEKNDTLIITASGKYNGADVNGFEWHAMIEENSLQFIEFDSNYLDSLDLESFFNADTLPNLFSVLAFEKSADGTKIEDDSTIFEVRFVALQDIPSSVDLLIFNDSRDNGAFVTTDSGQTNTLIAMNYNYEIIPGFDPVAIEKITREYVEFSSLRDAQVNLQVSGVDGKTYYNERFYVKKGQSVLRLPSHLPTNQLLIVSVTDGKNVYSKKLMSID